MAITTRRNQDGSIRYQVKVLDRNREWFPALAFEKKEDALHYEAELIAKKRKGSKSITEDARNTSVSDYWDVWSIENRGEVSEGWKISQDQMYRDYVYPVIGQLSMIRVGTPEIGKVLNRMKQMGRSDQMRKHVYSLLRKMFGDAVEYYEMLTVNPVKPKFHRPKVARRMRQFLMPQAAMELCEASKGSYLGPPTNLGMLSALRISEIQALKGKHLLFAKNMLLVCSAFNNKTGVLQDFPKQEDWAYVPMPPLLKDYLLSLKRKPEEWVAPGPKGEMLSYETYLCALKRLCRKVGVHTITPHELRHSSTEIWIQAGATAEDIRRLLNHSSLTATANYIHRTDERLNRLAAGINAGNNVLCFPKSFPNGKKVAFDALTEEAANEQ